jgi:hypothetical protein
VSRGPGHFVRLSVDFADDARILAAGEAAEGVFVRSLAWCARMGTDGRVPRSALPILSRRAPNRAQLLAEKLCAVGLWERDGEDFRVRRYTKWQTTTDQIEELREAQRERTRRSRARAAESGESVTRESRVTRSRKSAGVTRDSAAVVTRESRVTSALEVEGEGEGEDKSTTTAVALRDDAPSARSLVAEWIDHERNEKHADPPKRVVGMVSKGLRELLDEGQPYDRVRAGLVAWAQSQQHPSTLATFVHRVGQTSRRSTTDTAVRQGLDLVARFESIERQSS